MNGTPVDALFRIEYRAADRESWWSRIGDIAGRFADGKASFVGSWTMWVALGFTLLAIGVGLFGLAGMPRRRAALLCALVAVLNALAWGLLVPPFQVPDEESHTAYVQYLAETGKVPKPGVVGYRPRRAGCSRPWTSSAPSGCATTIRRRGRRCARGCGRSSARTRGASARGTPPER